MPATAPCWASCQPIRDANSLRPDGFRLVTSGDAHGGLVLALMAEQGVDLGTFEALGPLDVVGQVRSPQEQCRRTVGLDPEFAVEVRVTRRDQRVEGEEAGGPVVGMEPVPTPRVVAEYHVGSYLADEASHRTSGVDIVHELAVDSAEEPNPVGGCVAVAVERIGRAATLVHPCRHQAGDVLVRVPSCLWNRRSGRGGGRDSRPPPTWRAWHRRRTRCRSGWAPMASTRSGVGRSTVTVTVSRRSPVGSPGHRSDRSAAQSRGLGGRHAPAFMGSREPRPPSGPCRPARHVPCQVGQVQHAHRHSDAGGLGPVAGEGAGTVREVEAGVGREGDHVGAVAVPVGNEGDTRRRPHLGDAAGQGEIGMGDRHLRHPRVA